VAYELTPDGRKMLYGAPGSRPDAGMTWAISSVPPSGMPVPKGLPAGMSLGGGDGKVLNLDAIEVRVDPTQEWKQILHEAWRVNRDFFYDPGMHGADWAA